jgi:hypothetical protein
LDKIIYNNCKAIFYWKSIGIDIWRDSKQDENINFTASTLT